MWAKPLDVTGIGILLGLVLAILYASLRGLRQRSFDIGSILLVFLAGFSIPGGTALITAGIIGNPSDLPSSWREYVAVSGIVAIGLATQHLWKSAHAAWTKSA